MSIRDDAAAMLAPDAGRRAVEAGPKDALRLFVNRLTLRSVLSEAELDAIMGLPGRVARVGAGHDIILPGQHTDQSCMVAAGLVARFDMMADGRRQIVAFHLPGDMCDLHSVPVPTSGWGLEALCPATLLFIPHSALRELARDATIGMAFWRDTVVDGSILAKWAANLGRKRASPRLAHLFCEIGMRLEQVGRGSKVDFGLPVTQAQLADAVGLTSVHLNRTLMALREEGVSFSGKRIRIADWDRLTHLAEFDPAYLLVPEARARR